MSKVIFIVLDGLGDGFTEKTTALQLANKTHLDYLASIGQAGVIYPVAKGFVPETDTGMLSLFGYDVRSLNVRRAPIEWLALTGSFPSDSLAMRVNFATLHEDNTVDRDTGKDLSSADAARIVEALNLELKSRTDELHDISLLDTTTYQAAGLMLIHGAKRGLLSDHIANTDPWYPVESMTSISRVEGRFEKSIQCTPLDDSAAARRTASIINKFSDLAKETLSRHPINLKRRMGGKQEVNYLLLRHPGMTLPSLVPMKQKSGISAAYFHDLNLEKGIGILSGVETIKISSAQPFSLDEHILEKDYTWIASRLFEMSESYDVIFVHVKGPDKAAHLGDLDKKVKIVNLIDKVLIGNILQKIDFEQTIICVTADHSTPWYLKLHSDDPVPVIVAGGLISKDEVDTYDERSCKKGTLPVENGNQLLSYILENVPKRL